MKKNYSVLFASFIALTVALPVSAASLSISSSFHFTKNLYGGSKGNEVQKLQILLNSNSQTAIGATAGEEGSFGNENGYYGLKTFNAVKAFQKIHNLPQVGYVGPSTREVLNAVLENGLLLEVESPRISTISVKKDTKEKSEILTVAYDGNGEVPSVSFAYGASVDSVTMMYPFQTGKSIKGSQSITLSNLEDRDYFVKAFVKNSFGTSTSTTLKFNGVTGI